MVILVAMHVAMGIWLLLNLLVQWLLLVCGAQDGLDSVRSVFNHFDVTFGRASLLGRIRVLTANANRLTSRACRLNTITFDLFFATNGACQSDLDTLWWLIRDFGHLDFEMQRKERKKSTRKREKRFN